MTNKMKVKMNEYHQKSQSCPGERTMQRSATNPLPHQHKMKEEKNKINSTTFVRMSKEEDDTGIQEQLKEIFLPIYDGNEIFKKRQMKRNQSLRLIAAEAGAASEATTTTCVEEYE